MKKTFLFTAVLLLAYSLFSAQEKTIDTVFIFDRQLSEARKTQQLYDISVSDIQKNSTNLSEILRFQTPVYIKENGRGAVSAPSFRGTTAQQTSFLWNGIPVNSMFLGQGDINNLSLLNYDRIEVKSGGGSVEYGSAAIGGTIHLNNQLSFKRGFQGKIFAEYGSFDTWNTSLKTAYSNDKVSLVFSAAVSQSENEYEVPQVNYLNRNGAYQNQTFNLSAGYKFNDKNEVFWHSQHFTGEQHFPIFEPQQTRTKYVSESFRSLISWKNSGKRHNNLLSTAYLEENFSFFSQLSLPRANGGSGKSLYLKNDFEYDVAPYLRLNMLAQALQEKGEGYLSGIQSVSRWAGSAAAILKYEKQNLYLEAGAKKEFIEKIEAPFLFSIGGKFDFNEEFSIKFKGSKNFRYPSFNDLYWQPGGNTKLKPETSYQAEITPEISLNGITFSITPFYSQINDMIRWLPVTAAIWGPVNTHKVEVIGLESMLKFTKRISKGNLSGNVGYSYTRSENMQTGYQLSYVPVQKAFGMLQYRLEPLEFFVQGMFNGQTFTTNNESKDDDLNPYFVTNAGVSASLIRNIKLGFRVNNIFNTVYATSAYYYMPQRNFSANIAINF